jgi:hypothetical protein
VIAQVNQFHELDGGNVAGALGRPARAHEIALERQLRRLDGGSKTAWGPDRLDAGHERQA